MKDEVTDMVQAMLNGEVVAESDDTVVVEGNHYFPMDSVRPGALTGNDRRTVCGWKGEASYFDVHVDGASAAAGAWTYTDPRPKADDIRGRVAFWGGVLVRETD